MATQSGKFPAILRPMRILFLTLVFALLAQPLAAQTPEHVILCGGPALRSWENLREPSHQHDRFWGNFVRASTLRMAEIRKAYGRQAKLVWIVYRPGYVNRATEEGKPLVKWIAENAAKRNCQLIWVSSGTAAIRALNSRPTGSVVSFDFFGHSNKHCMMLDYSSNIMGACNAWIHENDIPKIRRGIFARNAVCQSWGCHTGESMSAKWRSALGVSLVGAVGKTDYVPISQGRLPSVSGRWVR